MDRRIRALNEQEVEGGSTDVGDVSWVVPTLHLTVVTSPKDAPWHAWPVVATGGMSIGHKGMIIAVEDAGRDHGGPVREAADAARGARGVREEDAATWCSRPIYPTDRRRVPKD